MCSGLLQQIFSLLAIFSLILVFGSRQSIAQGQDIYDPKGELILILSTDSPKVDSETFVTNAVLKSEFAGFRIYKTSEIDWNVTAFDGYRLKAKSETEIRKLTRHVSGSQSIFIYAPEEDPVSARELIRAVKTIPRNQKVLGNNIRFRTDFSNSQALAQHHSNIFKGKRLLGFSPLGPEFSGVVEFGCACMLEISENAWGTILVLFVDRDQLLKNKELIGMIKADGGIISTDFNCVFYKAMTYDNSDGIVPENKKKELEEFIDNWILKSTRNEDN